MPKRTDVDSAVVAVIRSWAGADDLDAAALALSKGRLGLDPKQRVALQNEIAEICAESLVEVIAKEEGLEEGETQDVMGLPLLPKQCERLSAWVNDQQQTADALGLELEAWSKQLISGMERYVASENGMAEPGTKRSADMEKARQLLGEQTGKFENRPELGTSKQSGIQGILGARAFQKKGR